MKSESSYLAARIVAETIENHFFQQLAEARQRGELSLGSGPSAQVIEVILDAAFWASLRHEEGHSPKISLVFLSPDQAGNPLLFEEQLPLTAANLTKLSLGVERPGVHLGVGYNKEGLYIWGTTLNIPDLCLVVDVPEPGLLVVKHRRLHGLGKFANVAVLKGDQVKIVHENSAASPDCPPLLRSLLGFTSPSSWIDSINVLIQLAVSMRSHKHGGTLLVVPDESDTWRKSIIHPIKYSIAPAYVGLRNLILQEEKERSSTWQVALRKEVDMIAGLTAVDGATVIGENFELKAFGAKITRLDGNPRVEQILLGEPTIDGKATIVNPAHNGGTRHLSAAQFVHDQPNSLALVASQDGHFTIFTWTEKNEMVQAHRIDTLLL